MKLTTIKKILSLDIIISGFFMTVLIALTFLGVILRYCLSSPIIWGEEVQLALIVIIVFFAGAAGFRHGSHIAIDFIVDRFSPKNQKIVEITIAIISSLILLYFAAQGGLLAHQMFETKRTTDILEIEYFFHYMSFPIGCLLMVVNLIVVEYERLSGRKTQ
jgi:TRAP-type C4-dicarboxylate transport system permease small subunit